jgi:hypothetical protein
MSSPSPGPAPPLAPLFPLVSLNVTNASQCYSVAIQFDSWDYASCPANNVTCSPIQCQADTKVLVTNKIVNEVAGYVRASFTLTNTAAPSQGTLVTGMVYVPVDTRAACFTLYTLPTGATQPDVCTASLTVIYKTLPGPPLNSRYLYLSLVDSCTSAPPA